MPISCHKLIDRPTEIVQQTRHFIEEALKIAYDGKPVPAGVYDLLASQDKPGKVCALFFHGRSGSFFAQSFFDSYRHPEVITAHPLALGWIDSTISPLELQHFNSGELTPGPVLGQWCNQIIQKVSAAFYAPFSGTAI